MHKLRVIQIGGSLGVALPKEITNHLQVNEGDALYVKFLPNGLKVSPYNTDLETEIAMGEALMDEYRETFKALDS